MRATTVSDICELFLIVAQAVKSVVSSSICTCHHLYRKLMYLHVTAIRELIKANSQSAYLMTDEYRVL